MQFSVINIRLEKGPNIPTEKPESLRPKYLRIRPFKLLIIETLWRRERDSNPRYPFRHNGFQDRRYQPLTHPSAASRWGTADNQCN
jgi:hypothetical protein